MTTSETATVPSALQEQQAPHDDDEGLRRTYDVVLVGTGLVQSILASALSRAGLAVLHCDAADYYGELDAVWTLAYVQKLAQQQNEKKQQHHDDITTTTPTHTMNSNQIPLHPLDEVQLHAQGCKTFFPITTVGTLVSTPYGEGRVRSLDDTSHKMTIDLIHWKLADGKHAQLLVPLSNESESKTNMNQNQQQSCVQSIASTRAQAILHHHSRSLALDVTPTLIYAAGLAVDSLLTSHVADYLEWKAVEGLVYWNPRNQSWEPVPCNKQDVFASKLLTPMEKRRLVKFLQLAMDYATQQQQQQQQQQQVQDEINNKNSSTETNQDAIASLNERHLNQGRSLARPQNKTVAKDELEILHECMDQNMSFATYLQEKQKLSAPLMDVVRYALALETGENGASATKRSSRSSSSNDDNGTDDDSSSNHTPVLLRDGMQALCAHLAALGRFGGTAFLVPLYGSGELPQAFCRSAAVYGATYLLRRSPLAIETTNAENHADDNTNNSKVTGVVLHKNINNDENENNENSNDGPAKDTKIVACSHVVAPLSMVDPSKTSVTKRVLRRISVLSGKPIGNGTDQQRHVVIIPPGAIGNQAAIHGLLFDEGVKVAPHVPGGSTVVHLTTTVSVLPDAEKENIIDHAVLNRALDKILADAKEPVHEVFHTVFSYPLSEATSGSCTTATTSSYDASDVPSGLHLVHRSAPGFEAGPAFAQAASIFGKICPRIDFLTMSKAMDDAIKERAGDALQEEDDEQMVLESAMGMIQQNDSAPAGSDQETKEGES